MFAFYENKKGEAIMPPLLKKISLILIAN